MAKFGSEIKTIPEKEKKNQSSNHENALEWIGSRQLVSAETRR